MNQSYKIADFDNKENLNKYLETLTDKQLQQLFLLNQQLIKVEGKSDLWQFQKARVNTWYKNDRTYLKKMCQIIQAVYEKKIINIKTGKPFRKVMLNAPPQFGKSLTMQGAISWFLGQDPKNRIISISYNEKLSSRVGKNIRDTIDENKINPEKFVFNDFFPELEINHTDASRTFWALKEQFFNFLGSSPTGTITGIGANIMMIDDLVKNSLEANNSRILQEHWEFYTDTLLSRAHEGALWFIIMTRWNTKDICGRLLEIEPEEWLVINFEAYNTETNQMLCDSVMSLETYLEKKRKTSPEIFMANFHQVPIDKEGALYDTFRTYFDRDVRYKEIWGYCDPANKGKDFLSAGFVGERKDVEELQVLNWIHTQKGMEYTKPLIAENIVKYGLTKFYIEDNSESYFVTSLKEYLRQNYPECRCKIIDFTQLNNKEARILSTAFDATNLIVFPENWDRKYPELHSQVTSYQRNGKNEFDDGADVIAGIVEKHKSHKKSNGFANW